VGQKISAYALRLGINQDWQSRYFAPKRKQAEWLQQEKLIRDYLFTRFPEIIQIKIERTETELFIFVRSPNTSLITGESNDNLDVILNKIAQIMKDPKIVTKLYLENEKDINSSPQALANNLAQQLESRVVLRSALRTTFHEVRDYAVFVNGRVDKSEYAQAKKNNRGRMPSSRLDSIIDRGFTEASTERGQVGITVLIYKGRPKK